jgi:hypothetical protein
MKGTNFVPYDFEQVVESMQVDGKPYYDFGHRLEIVDLFTKKNNNQFKYTKYPLIALRLDVDEANKSGLVDLSKLNIAILTVTDKNYTARQRYDNVIIPVLFPLYKKFMKALNDSCIFYWKDMSGDPPHTRIDRPYWGTQFMEGNDKNIFNDPIDAIEILNLQMTKKQYKC